MELYKKLATPEADAIKQITAGRLRGKSDINPQWRYEVMTENFGLCGIGWKFEVVNREFVSASDNQIAVFVDINLYVKVDGEWTEPIPGNGGDIFVAKESKGLYTSDDAVKMATTDALGTAMKMIGVAADIYRGKKTNKPPQTKHDKEKTPRKMNEEQFQSALRGLKKGKTIKEIKEVFNGMGVFIDEETETKLKNSANDNS